MFVVLLRFVQDRSSAQPLMQGHNEWLAQGFADGVFVLAGSIRHASGGAIIAHDIGADEIRTRVDADPLVAEGVVSAEVIEIVPGQVDERLAFLLDDNKVG